MLSLYHTHTRTVHTSTWYLNPCCIYSGCTCSSCTQQMDFWVLSRYIILPIRFRLNDLVTSAVVEYYFHYLFLRMQHHFFFVRIKFKCFHSSSTYCMEAFFDFLHTWRPLLYCFFFFFAWQSAHQASLCKNCWFEFRAHLHRLGTPRDSQTNWATSMIGNLCVCVLSSTMNISGCLLENRKETFQTYRWMYLCNQRDSVWTIFVVFVYGPHLCKSGKKYFN